MPVSKRAKATKRRCDPNCSTPSQMEEHGKILAGLHTLSQERAPERLLTRLAKNEKVLFEVRDLLTEVVQDNHGIIPAGEWRLANFHLIEEQILAATTCHGSPKLAWRGASPPC